MKKATEKAGISADAAKVSAEAAKSAAETAKETLDSSKQSFKQEERAYLWANSYSMGTPPICSAQLGEIRVCADVHFVNSGRTPAIGVHIRRSATFGANAERVIKEMKVHSYTSHVGDLLGSVGEKIGTAFTDPIDEKTANEIEKGTIPLYVYGVVQYFDIFGDYHETGFCNYKLPSGFFMDCGWGNWFETDKRPSNKK